MDIFVAYEIKSIKTGEDLKRIIEGKIYLATREIDGRDKVSRRELDFAFVPGENPSYSFSTYRFELRWEKFEMVNVPVNLEEEKYYALYPYQKSLVYLFHTSLNESITNLVKKGNELLGSGRGKEIDKEYSVEISTIGKGEKLEVMDTQHLHDIYKGFMGIFFGS